MDKVKFARSLGIVGALLVPAVVVAQQFAPNQPLRSADLQLLVANVTQLTARVTALESALQSGPGAQAFDRIEVDGSTSYTARGDGFIGVVPGGTGFPVVDVQASVNGGVTDRHFRATNGDSFNAIVSQGDSLTVTVGDMVETANVVLYWYPLRRNAAAPLCGAVGGCSTP